MPAFQALPPELIAHVCQHLDARDLVKIRPVSSVVRDVADSALRSRYLDVVREHSNQVTFRCRQPSDVRLAEAPVFAHKCFHSHHVATLTPATPSPLRSSTSSSASLSSRRYAQKRAMSLKARNTPHFFALERDEYLATFNLELSLRGLVEAPTDASPSAREIPPYDAWDEPQLAGRAPQDSDTEAESDGEAAAARRRLATRLYSPFIGTPVAPIRVARDAQTGGGRSTSSRSRSVPRRRRHKAPPQPERTIAYNLPLVESFDRVSRDWFEVGSEAYSTPPVSRDASPAVSDDEGDGTTTTSSSSTSLSSFGYKPTATRVLAPHRSSALVEVTIACCLSPDAPLDPRAVSRPGSTSLYSPASTPVFEPPKLFEFSVLDINVDVHRFIVAVEEGFCADTRRRADMIMFRRV